MSKRNKLWNIIAVGLLLFAGAIIALNFIFTKLRPVTTTYEINEAFHNISMDVDTADIEFVLSDNQQCKIVCFDKARLKHSAAVKDGTLTIRTARKWYDHINIFFRKSKMTVYLPKTEYASLLIKGGTGDIKIPKDFAFDTVDISVSTGDAACYASASERMKIKLSTGHVHVEDISAGELDLSASTGGVTASSIHCQGDINVTVSTGKVQLTDVSCRNIISSGSTGNILLKNVIAAENFSIKRSTGNVLLEGSDAAEIHIKTSTGSVTGTLLSEKAFNAKSNTGSVHVPKTAAGGICEIKTSTGSIQIDIQ